MWSGRYEIFKRRIFVDNWKNILDENILKTNINFAAVFVMNYECLKEFVIEQVRIFIQNIFIWMVTGLCVKSPMPIKRK